MKQKTQLYLDARLSARFSKNNRSKKLSSMNSNTLKIERKNR